MMTVIAVAGGTGGVGKTFVERLSQESGIKLIVLSRNVSFLVEGES
jgi:short-subunit dehydrogenase